MCCLIGGSFVFCVVVVCICFVSCRLVVLLLCVVLFAVLEWFVLFSAYVIVLRVSVRLCLCDVVCV